MPVLNPIRTHAPSRYSCAAAVAAAIAVLAVVAADVDARARRLASSQARDHHAAMAAAMAPHRVLRLHAVRAAAAAKQQPMRCRPGRHRQFSLPSYLIQFRQSNKPSKIVLFVPGNGARSGLSPASAL
ncbi:MAG: hypothetical protein JWQ61_3218 [Collimonas fungivorans]|nr:hypothetical protein [Collimonas fungivorans]